MICVICGRLFGTPDSKKKTCSKECSKAYVKAYHKTDKYKAYMKAYQKTDKHKSYQKAYQEAYYQRKKLERIGNSK